MIRKNMKKGFTLIELLAVILILGVVLSISSYFIVNTIKNSKDKSNDISLSSLKNSAKLYVVEYGENNWYTPTENEESLKDYNNIEFSCTSIGLLKQTGYLKSNSNLPNGYDDNTKLLVIRNKDSLAIKDIIIDSNGTCVKYDQEPPKVTFVANYVSPTKVDLNVVVSDESGVDNQNIFYKWVKEENGCSTDGYKQGSLVNGSFNSSFRGDTGKYYLCIKEGLKDKIGNATSISKSNTYDIVKGYNVSLDTNGGQFSDGNVLKVKEVIYRNSYGDLESPVREGFAFLGWYDPNNNKINSDTLFTFEDDIKLKAKWKDNVNPICSLNVSTSGVSMTYSDNVEVTDYGLSTSSDVDYNGYASKSLSPNTFYGYVRDAVGNTGSCKVTLTGTSSEAYCPSGYSYCSWCSESNCYTITDSYTYDCSTYYYSCKSGYVSPYGRTCHPYYSTNASCGKNCSGSCYYAGNYGLSTSYGYICSDYYYRSSYQSCKTGYYYAYAYYDYSYYCSYGTMLNDDYCYY